MAFGSGANYFIGANGQPLGGLTVTLTVTEDIVPLVSAAGRKPQNPAFTLQVNCYAGAPGPLGNSAWQQYVFTLSQDGAGGKLTALVENWPSSEFAKTFPSASIKDGFIDSGFPVQPVLLSSPKLPAKYQLSVTLGTDAAGRVTAATFSAYDESGKQLFANPNTINLYNLQTTAHTPVGVEDLSPILAVQVSLVGNNTGRTVLSSGAGTITYRSLVQPFIGAQEPPWLGYQTLNAQWPEPTSLGYQGGTYEQANSVYAETLSGDDVFGLVQPFGVVTHTPGQALAATRQFGTTNRTDVFAIGSTGQLTMFYVEDSGAWSMHAPIGPGNFPPTGSVFAPPGAQLAVSQQFGIANRTDVFVVDNTGTLNCFYCDNGDVKGWQGPIAISAAGFAPPGAHLAACQRAANANQTDVYVVDHTGTLHVFSVVGSGNWSAPVKISAEGFAPAGAAVAASSRYGVTDQTDVYVAQTSGAMNVFSVGSAGMWSKPAVISEPGFQAPPWATIIAAPRAGVSGQTDVYVTDHNGQLTVFSWLHLIVPVPHFGPVWTTTLIGPALYPDESGATFAPNGAPIAVSPQFGVTTQTDVFIVDSVGALNVFWVEADGAWNGPLALSNPSGGKLNVPAGSYIAATAQFGVAGQTDVLMISTLPTPLPMSPGLGWPCVFWVENSSGWNGPAALVLEA
jgi:hypothetical protein